MAVELKQIADYLDIDPEKDWDEVKEQIDSSFVRATPDAVKSNKKLYDAVLGGLNGAVITRIKQKAKDLGVELTKDDIEGVDQTIDLIDVMAERTSEKLNQYPSKIEELTGQLEEAKKKGASAKDVEELTAKLQSYEQKYKDLEDLHNSTVQDFEGYKQQVGEEKKSFIVNTYKQKARESVKLKTKSDWERKGFLNDVDSKYKIDVDGDEPIVRNAEGERVKNPDKAGAFMTYEDVLKKEAKDAGLLDDSPHTGKTVRTNAPVIHAPDDKDKRPERQPRKSAVQL